MSVIIHGKEYKTVAERVNAIHAQHKGEVEIHTELIAWKEGVIIAKGVVTIHNNEKVRVYSDYASEKEGSSPINRTSAMENCCTSAIGRALAAAGYAGTEYASADEVANALKQGEETFFGDANDAAQRVFTPVGAKPGNGIRLATDKQLNALRKSTKNKTQQEVAELLGKYGCTKFEELDVNQASSILDELWGDKK